MAFVILAIFLPALAAGQSLSAAAEPPTEDQIRSEIAAMGTGKTVRIAVRLKAGRTLKGYVSARDAAGFDLVDEDGDSQHISYSEVESVRKRKAPSFWGRLPVWARRAVVTGAIFAAVVVTIELIRRVPPPPELPPPPSSP